MASAGAITTPGTTSLEGVHHQRAEPLHEGVGLVGGLDLLAVHGRRWREGDVVGNEQKSVGGEPGDDLGVDVAGQALDLVQDREHGAERGVCFPPAARVGDPDADDGVGFLQVDVRLGVCGLHPPAEGPRFDLGDPEDLPDLGVVDLSAHQVALSGDGEVHADGFEHLLLAFGPGEQGVEVRDGCSGGGSLAFGVRDVENRP
jgi:hypothetical protein